MNWSVSVRRRIRQAFNISDEVELSGPYIDFKLFFFTHLCSIDGSLFFELQLFLLLLACRIDGIIVGESIKTLTL